MGNTLHSVGLALTGAINVSAGVAVSLAFAVIAGMKHRRLFTGDMGPLFGKMLPAIGAGAGLSASLYYIGKAFSLGAPTDCGGLSRNELTGAFAFSAIIGAVVAIRAAALVFVSAPERAPTPPAPELTNQQTPVASRGSLPADSPK